MLNSNAIERLRTLNVADVMAREVIGVMTHQPMADIANLMLRHQISSAPVVDESGVCVGIISATDFLRRETAGTKSVPGESTALRGWVPEDIASSYMSTGVQSIPATSSILQAARIMRNQHIHHLPVVDKAGRPVGIVSTMDLVAALDNAIEETSAQL